MQMRASDYGQLHRVANVVLDGPTSIRPPASVDRNGWLIRAIALRVHLATPIPGKRMAVYREPEEAVALYTDDTANRTKGFLPPLIRYASWDRFADLRRQDRDSSRPRVQVVLGTIGSRQITLAFIAQLQRRLRRLPFEPYFSTRRGVPPGRGGGPPGRMSIFVYNGAQEVDYTAPTRGPNRGLARLVIAGLRLFRNQIRPFSPRGWREYYPFNPAGQRWDTDASWT
jgi:hypothetical protein